MKNIHLRKISFSHISLLLVLIFSLGCIAKVEHINLRLNLSVGDEQTIVSKIETVGSVIILNVQKEVNFKVINKSDDNVYHFTSTLTKVQLEKKLFGDLEVYTSEKDPDLMNESELAIHSEYASLLDSNFFVSINDMGQVVESFHYKNGSPPSEGILDLDVFQIEFPEEKVTVGSTWMSETINAFTSKVIKLEHKIKEITDTEVVLEVKHVIPSMEGVFDSNALQGEYRLEKSTGKLIKGQMEMKLSMGGKSIISIYQK